MLGRGTVVWRKNGTLFFESEMALKTAWWRPVCTFEAEISGLGLFNSSKGLARFVTKNDAHALSGDVATVRWLRNPSKTTGADMIPVLHRLITKDVGRPIWDYTSDLELLQAMRAILNGERI